MTNTVLQPVVMAGGSGTRLWPLSRAGFPKQHVVLPGDTAVLQQGDPHLRDVAVVRTSDAAKVAGPPR